jgi:hypothetical protein
MGVVNMRRRPQFAIIVHALCLGVGFWLGSHWGQGSSPELALCSAKLAVLMNPSPGMIPPESPAWLRSHLVQCMKQLEPGHSPAGGPLHTFSTTVPPQPAWRRRMPGGSITAEDLVGMPKSFENLMHLRMAANDSTAMASTDAEPGRLLCIGVLTAFRPESKFISFMTKLTDELSNRTDLRLVVWQSVSAARNLDDRETLTRLGFNVHADTTGYPELDGSNLELNYGDSVERVRWRSKQAMDYSNVLQKCYEERTRSVIKKKKKKGERREKKEERRKNRRRRRGKSAVKGGIWMGAEERADESCSCG